MYTEGGFARVHQQYGMNGVMAHGEAAYMECDVCAASGRLRRRSSRRGERPSGSVSRSSTRFRWGSSSFESEFCSDLKQSLLGPHASTCQHDEQQYEMQVGVRGHFFSRSCDRFEVLLIRSWAGMKV